MLTGALFLGAACGKQATSASSSSAAAGAQPAKPDIATLGSLTVTSNLDGTTVDATRQGPGEPSTNANRAAPAGAKEQSLNELPPGRYLVVARAPRFADLKEEVYVEAGHAAKVDFHFKGGSLRIESDPAGAMVRLGESALGKTPLTVPVLPVGDCTLSLEYPSWPAVRYTATILEETETKASVRLPHGRLVVESTPSGATVTLAGRNVGVTPLTLATVPVGERKLLWQLKDFPAMETTVSIKDNNETRANVVMGTGFPILDPSAMLDAVWMEAAPDDPNKIAPAFTATTGFKSQNGIVRNLDRKKVFEGWLGKKFRYTGTVRSYDKDSGQIEFIEQNGTKSSYRVAAVVTTDTRRSPETADRLKRGTTVTLFGKITGIEESPRIGQRIAIDLNSAELLP